MTTEQDQTRSLSPLIIDETQRENEERFDRLQSEMTNQKVLMEKLLEQNAERNRQMNAAPTTSSYDTHASNIQLDFSPSVRSLVPGIICDGMFTIPTFSHCG